MNSLCDSCIRQKKCTKKSTRDMHVGYCIEFIRKPVKRAKSKCKVKPCPLCGSTDLTVKPFDNDKGKWISCNNEKCGLWAHKLTLEEWNHRAFPKHSLNKFLLDVETVYTLAHSMVESQEFVCRCCKKRGTHPDNIQHVDGCKVKQLLDLF